METKNYALPRPESNHPDGYASTRGSNSSQLSLKLLSYLLTGSSEISGGVLGNLKGQLGPGKSLARAFDQLSAGEAAQISQPIGKEKLSVLLNIAEGENFWEDVQQFAIDLKYSYENDNRLLAGKIFNFILSSPEAPTALAGKAQMEISDRAEAWMGSFYEQVTDWKMILPMMFASPVFQAGKLAGLRGLSTLGVEGFSARGMAGLGGLVGETVFFTGAHRALVHHFDGPVSWEPGEVGMDLLRTGLTLGILKGAAFAGRQGILRGLRLNEALPSTWTGAQQEALAWGANASGYLGLVGSHWFQEKSKLIQTDPNGNLWIDSLAAHLALGIGSRAGRKVFGRPLLQLEQQLALKTNALYQPSVSSRNWLQSLKNIFSVSDGNGFPPGMVPAAAGIGSGFLSVIPSETSPRGPSRDHVFQAKAHGEGGGRVDPKNSLGVLPTGSLTPHGDEVSTHQRAVGDKRWVGRVAVYNGHLKYQGDGKYEVVKGDEAMGLSEGQILTSEEAAYHFEEVVKPETGFRPLASDLPIETDWAGQIPTGFRGEEGKTEASLLKLMGLTKRQIREQSFSSSGTLITRADQFALQGLFALYRSAVQWGVRLEEIVGNDPRRMAVAVSAGLGGMNNLVDLITASTQRRLKDGAPTFMTVPMTTPMMLPSLLIDSMQGLLVAILGPKGDSYPATLARNSIIQTVGRIPVNVGACATGYKTFGDAADMFRPNWPGQIPTELAFFGSSEASFGRRNARTTATGFNAMGAMETRERLEGRGGRLEDGYAPLSKDVKGFWPTEGAGAGALMRISRQVELGLPIQARVLGYSIMGDQGGKPNPAGLGLGGLTTLLESLNMMVEWQRTPVDQLAFMSLHGTGTPDNNRVEPTNLLKALEAFAFDGQVKLSAFKAFLGHGLGAAGSMEIALLGKILQEQVAPGVFNLEGRAIDENVQALGEKVAVNSEVTRGDLSVVGGQSQGFAGNNAAALLGRVTDQVLHEVYGYSNAEIEAYRARESERLDQARQWEESILKGEQTIGDFLSWFGLGETPPDKVTHFDPQALPRMGSPDTVEEIPGSMPPVLAPELLIKKKFAVTPDKAIALIGEGAGLTPHGSWRTTRRVTLGEADAVAYKAWDAGLVKFAGFENGKPRWLSAETGKPISVEEIKGQFGEDLETHSGLRTLERLPYSSRDREIAKGLLLKGIEGFPVGSPERNKLVAAYEALEVHPIDFMVADFGGLVPTYLRNNLYQRMGMTASDLRGTRLGGAHHKLILKAAGEQTQLYLWGALEVLNQLGGRLPELYPHPRKVGFSFGAAFESYDALAKLLDTHRDGKNFTGLETPFSHALLSQPPAVLANILGPEFTYRHLKKNPRAIEGIVPPDMVPAIGPNTMGPVRTEVAACASGFYALATAAEAMVSDLPGKWRPDLFILGAADASLAPLNSPFVITSFSDAAPISRERLNELGITPAQASMPLTRDASGLVVSEGAGAIGMTTLASLVARRQLAGAIVAGWGTSLGEGGKEQLMGMDEGSVSATLEAINMGIEGHGMNPGDIDVVQLHGTSTRLNNIAELVSLKKALGAYPGEQVKPILNALKGSIGHSMGAASMLDLLQAVSTLREQRIPGLANFSMDRIDPRFENYHGMELQPHFEFPTEARDANVESILGITQGFGSRNGAVLLRRFDPEILRRYEWPPEMKEQVEDYIAAWPDIVAEYEAKQQDFMAGKTNHGQLALDNAYPNPALDK